ncbi:MAG: hypothetical protein LUH00_09715 [Lachnospiraceae bacterium]|nr:hypothetical protein [Lachnospiraceae bacterium]
MKKKNKTDAVIHMTVKDDSDFLSVYSVTDTPVISSEVAQFLEHSIQDLIRPDHSCFPQSQSAAGCAAI